MNKEIREEILKKYNERLKKFGYDPKSLGWFKGRQNIRFKVLSEIGELNNSSILDVGCGFGDLYGYLKKRGLDIKYNGIDINSEFIEIGKKIYPEAKLKVQDLGEMDTDINYDYIFASGFFEFKTPERDYLKNMLKKMFKICNKGIGANFLSSYVDFMNEEANYINPEEIFKICKTLSKRVTIRHDFMPFEFCVYIYKNDTFTERNVFKEFEQVLKDDED